MTFIFGDPALSQLFLLGTDRHITRTLAYLHVFSERGPPPIPVDSDEFLHGPSHLYI